jgi:perosamine synthetase
MTARKKAVADFRYDTGPSRIPWCAVGEAIDTAEVEKVIEFLLPPGAGKASPHAARLRKVKNDLRHLGRVSGRATKLSLGRQVKALEEEVAAFLKTRHASFVTNATAGFEIGFRYANLGPGDEVIAPAITFIATIAYPMAVGARVVLADVDPRTLNMDPADVERKITKRTKVIIPVHIGGYPVEMDKIMALARRHNLLVIEDAAHAFGGKYHGKMIGTIGHFGAYSFHEVKNITSFGEGGALVTNLPVGKFFPQTRFLGVDLSRPIKDWFYDVVAVRGKYGPFVCGNSSSTEIQALVLREQIKRLRGIIAKRRAAARYLNNRFRGVEGIIAPLLDSPGIAPTHHLYLLQVDHQALGADIQVLRKKLTDRGVTNLSHFAPLYKFMVMRQMGYDTKAIEASCPNTETAFRHRFTHLPLYDFTGPQLKYMADVVIESVREMRAGR